MSGYMSRDEELMKFIVVQDLTGTKSIKQQQVYDKVIFEYTDNRHLVRRLRSTGFEKR